MKIALFSFIFMGLASCYYYAEPQFDLYIGGSDPCGFSKDMFNRPVKWERSQLPIKLYAHESVPDRAYYNFVSALDHWNEIWIDYTKSRGVDNPFLFFDIVGKGEKFSGRPANDGYNMMFFLDDYSGYRPEDGGAKTIQALTSTVSASGKIKDADILINAEEVRHYFDSSYDRYIFAQKGKSHEYRSFASTATPSLWDNIKSSLSRFFKLVVHLFQIKKPGHTHRQPDSEDIPRGLLDFPSLIIHELGHVAGLSHIPAEEESRPSFSVMERVLPKGKIRRKIEIYDLDNLFCGYYEQK